MIADPEQTFCVAGDAATVGLGFTVTVTLVVDVQLPAVAVIVNVVVVAAFVLFVNVPVMFPVPLVPIPERPAGLSLVQFNTVPVTEFGFETVTVPIGDPEQTVCVAGVALTVGVGFTVTVTIAVEEQLPAVAVTVKVVVIAAFVLFVNEPVIFPVPLVAIPERPAGLVLVQLKTVPAKAFGFVISI